MGDIPYEQQSLDFSDTFEERIHPGLDDLVRDVKEHLVKKGEVSFFINFKEVNNTTGEGPRINIEYFFIRESRSDNYPYEEGIIEYINEELMNAFSEYNIKKTNNQFQISQKHH